MKYIQNAWERYRKMCVPAEATDAQVRESRQAFFAGAVEEVKERPFKGWIGVDFDGTLAEYHGWKGPSVDAAIDAAIAAQEGKS